MDHWYKFNFAYALPNKSAVNVAEALYSQFFPYFGVPRIIQSGNSWEFVNEVIENLLQAGIQVFI